MSLLSLRGEWLGFLGCGICWVGGFSLLVALVVLAVCLIYVGLVLDVFGWLLLAASGFVGSVVCLRVWGGWCIWC